MGAATTKLKIRLVGHAAQERFWRSTARYALYVGGVGAGKTFAGAAKILTMPPGLGLVVAPTYTLVKDVAYRTLLEIAEPHGLIAYRNRSDLQIKLTTGQEILFRSADRPERLVGVNAAWAWGDEWAYVDEEAHDRLIARLRLEPGQFWATSTPNGRNWLYRRFVEAPAASVEVFRASSADNPYVPGAYVEALAGQYEGAHALQELEGQFVDLSGSARIPGEWLVEVRAFAEPVVARGLPALPGLRVFEAPAPGRRYVLGVDPSEGLSGGDASPVCVLDAVSGDQVAVLEAWLEPGAEMPDALAQLAAAYNGAAVLIERNNHGHAVIAGCLRLGVQLLNGPDGREGYLTTTTSKAGLWNRAAQAVREVDGQIRDARTFEQVGSIDRQLLAHPGKRRGQSACDDLACAWALAQMARFIEPLGDLYIGVM